MFSSILSILTSIGALVKYIAARAERHELEGIGRTKAVLEAMKDAQVILVDIAEAETDIIHRLRHDRERLLSEDPENRDNWPERNREGKDGS